MERQCLANRMMEYKLKRFIFSVFLVLFSESMPLNVAADENRDIYEQQKLTSHLLINLFMEQIEEDGLTIFGNALGKSDLHSHHVAYIHNTANDTLQVQLCFTLAKQILVPDFDSFFVEKITVEMDKNGNIIEILTHVSQVEQGQSPEKTD